MFERMKNFTPFLGTALVSLLLGCSEDSCFVPGSRVLTPDG